MNVYFDTSALVKLYVRESGTAAVQQLLQNAERSAATLVAKPELASALSRAIRAKTMSSRAGQAAWEAFCKDWSTLIRLRPSEPLVAHAGELVLNYGLRGYDAVHLATALHWQTLLGAPIVMATFDQLLWDTAKAVGLAVWPGNRP